MELKDILKKGKLSKDAIKKILSSKDKLFIGDFLSEYTFFDNEDLIYIQMYISKNLNHKNRMFVSDLIEFSEDYNLEIPYKKCLSFIVKKEGDDSLVSFAAMDYIFKNLKFQYINEIIDHLTTVVESSEYEQSAQVRSLFYLFRITHNKDYLIDLIDLIATEGHKELMKNLLSNEYNSQKYFEYHDALLKICTNGY